MKWQECKTCGYPHQKAGCGNPACTANPTLSDERRALLIEAQEERRAMREQREWLARVRERAAERKE